MNTTINRAADNIRILAASMVEKAKSGHPGGAMGGADYINVLYSEFLNFDPDDLSWENRDRFLAGVKLVSDMKILCSYDYNIKALKGDARGTFEVIVTYPLFPTKCVADGFRR